MRDYNAIVFAAFIMAALAACAEHSTAAEQPAEGEPKPENTATAVFAGGCFWCVEQAFDEVGGVLKTVSGYTGGDVKNPGYKQVSAGGTGHYEAVLVTYNPDNVGYDKLLDTFWHNIDPTDDQGQFCDKGASYKSAIFVGDKKQRQAAQASKQALASDESAPAPIETEILDAKTFYAAEDYHQDYYEKNPIRYNFYKTACGRKARLEELWGDKAGKP